jgi:hypothetical protein
MPIRCLVPVVTDQDPGAERRRNATPRSGVTRRNGPAATHEAASRLLRRLTEQGLLRPHDSDYAAWQLLNMSFGGCHTQLLFGLIHEVPEAQMETQLRRVAADFETLYGVGPQSRSHAPTVAP